MYSNRNHAHRIPISVRFFVQLAAVCGLALAFAAPAAAQIEPDPTPPGFEVPAVFTVGTSPYGLAMGDIDHDGLPDLAVVNKFDNTVSVFFNTGDWDPPTDGFGTPVVRTVVPGECDDCRPMEVALVDMNNDGSLDIVISRSGEAGADPGIAILLYVGGTDVFGPPILRDAPPEMERARGLVVDDIDRDGKLDIAVGGRARDAGQVMHPALGMLWGQEVGNLQFTPELFRVDDELGVGWDLAVGHFNSSSSLGKLDLALTNYDRAWIHVFLDGRQFTQHSYTARISLGIAADVLVYATDVDLAITAEFDDRFRWFLGDGAGGFVMQEPPRETGKCPFGIALGNVNFGPTADVVVANAATDPNGDITLWMARGDGTFNGPYYFDVDPPNTPKPCQVLIGDFDLDGMNDVVTANVGTNNISVLINALQLSGL